MEEWRTYYIFPLGIWTNIVSEMSKRSEIFKSWQEIKITSTVGKFFYLMLQKTLRKAISY